MKSLEIHNYKCLKKVSLEGLQRINLFTGKNNTGKSSVLEAISLLIAKGDVNWLNQLLEDRGEFDGYSDKVTTKIMKNHKLSVLSSFFYDRKTSFDDIDTITIDSGNHHLMMRFVRFLEEKITQKNLSGTETFIGKRKVLLNELEPINSNDVSVGFEVKINNKSTLLDFEDVDYGTHIWKKRNYDINGNFYFVNSKGDIENTSLLWDKITLSEKEDLVIEALKIIEPKINRLSFIGEDSSRRSRYPIVKLSNSQNIYPLKAMGDGINRILNLILALVNSDGGFLFIDEFENGLHYSIQEQLWKVMFEIAEQLDVQVFATTHSNDSIRSLANVLDENADLKGSLYRFARKGENIITHLFSKEEITEAAKQNINLR